MIMKEKTLPIEMVQAAAIQNGDNNPQDNLTLEDLVLLINTERLKNIKDKTKKELDGLKERQLKVKDLHELLKVINLDTDTKGAFDGSKNEKFQELLRKAKELGVNVKEDKFKYTKEERDRLVENIRITRDDYNVENDLQAQAISKLTNERYESYQMARTILRPIHDDKLRKAREIAGKG